MCLPCCMKRKASTASVIGHARCGSGFELAVAHAPHDVPQHRAEQGRPVPDHAVEVDGEEREVLVERLEAQPGVLIDVALADLQEAAVIGKRWRFPAGWPRRAES